MRWYLEVVKKYAVFGGRARRKEYWLFGLVNLIVAVMLGVIDMTMGFGDTENGVGVLSVLYALAVLLPGLGVSVRRLHDTTRSGWWLLIALVPFVGIIVLLIIMALDGQPGGNQYGPNPKELTAGRC